MSSKQRNINESRKLLSLKFNSKENVVKLSRRNTPEHEIAKFLVSLEALREGHDFVSEAIFTNGKRTDLFDLDTCLAIEILQSETKKQFQKKVASYPCDVISLDASHVIEVSLKNFLPGWRIEKPKG